MEIPLGRTWYFAFEIYLSLENKVFNNWSYQKMLEANFFLKIQTLSDIHKIQLICLIMLLLRRKICQICIPLLETLQPILP